MKLGLRRWILFAFVAAVTFLAYLPSLDNGFVDWDDNVNFLENRNYRGLGWANLAWMATSFHLGHYHPLTWVTLGFDYVLWEMDPFGYHLTNVVLHALSAVAFAWVASMLFAACRTAGFSRLDSERDRGRRGGRGLPADAGPQGRSSVPNAYHVEPAKAGGPVRSPSSSRSRGRCTRCASRRSAGSPSGARCSAGSSRCSRSSSHARGGRGGSLRSGPPRDALEGDGRHDPGAARADRRHARGSVTTRRILAFARASPRASGGPHRGCRRFRRRGHARAADGGRARRLPGAFVLPPHRAHVLGCGVLRREDVLAIRPRAALPGEHRIGLDVPAARVVGGGTRSRARARRRRHRLARPAADARVAHDARGVLRARPADGRPRPVRPADLGRPVHLPAGMDHDLRDRARSRLGGPADPAHGTWGRFVGAALVVAVLAGLTFLSISQQRIWFSAGTLWEREIEIVPNSPSGHFQLGRFYAGQQPPRADLAEEHLRTALASRPNMSTRATRSAVSCSPGTARPKQ